MRYALSSLTMLLVLAVLVGCSGQAAKPVTGGDVVAAFKAAGLEAEGIKEMGPKDYGIAPYVCKGTTFVIPSLGKAADGSDQGGHVYVCENAQDLATIQTFFKKVGEASALLASHLYVKGNTLLQINGKLDKALADKYGAALP